MAAAGSIALTPAPTAHAQWRGARAPPPMAHRCGALPGFGLGPRAGAPYRGPAMNRRLASLLLAALVAVTTGCSDDEPDPAPTPTPTPTIPTPTAPTADIRFETISEAAYVGGEQSTAITATSALGVVRVELFLDTMRIGAAEFAPFDIAWTTLDFAEGGHTLTARAHLGDGSYVDRSHRITVDNTPPSIYGLGRTV